MSSTNTVGVRRSSDTFHAGGLLNPSPGVTDLDGFRALQPLFDAAKEAGIWIVLRPGKLLSNQQ